MNLGSYHKGGTFITVIELSSLKTRSSAINLHSGLRVCVDVCARANLGDFISASSSQSYMSAIPLCHIIGCRAQSIKGAHCASQKANELHQ